MAHRYPILLYPKLRNVHVIIMVNSKQREFMKKNSHSHRASVDDWKGVCDVWCWHAVYDRICDATERFTASSRNTINIAMVIRVTMHSYDRSTGSVDDEVTKSALDAFDDTKQQHHACVYQLTTMIYCCATSQWVEWSGITCSRLWPWLLAPGNVVTRPSRVSKHFYERPRIGSRSLLHCTHIARRICVRSTDINWT